MPRGKNYRRSQAAKRREAGRRLLDVELLPPRPEFVPRRVTGKRCRVTQYPVSVSGKTHKLVVPAHSADKKFVLLVGDSHLRSFADGAVAISKGNLSFGVMSTPGASACHLRTELIHATLPRTPDAVCILAPGNNLTTSSTHEVAGEEFQKLLISARDRWENVFVVDFVPRLNVAPELQELMSNEFRSVANKMGMKYYSTFEHFPFSRLDLWVSDSVHLSDDEGMAILAKLLWDAAYKQLEVPAPKAQVSPRTPPPVPRTPPRLIVKEEVFGSPPSSPLPDLYVWMEMVKGKKRIQSEEQLCSPSKRRVAQHEVDRRPIVLKECFIPLNPINFSPSMLAAMDAVVPAHLLSPDCPAVPQDTVLKSTPSVEEAFPRLTPANVVELVAQEQADASTTGVTMSSEAPSTTAVEEVVGEGVSSSGLPIQRPSRLFKNVQSLVVTKEEDDPVSLDQENLPELPHIKEEQEEVWTSQDNQPEPRHIKEEQEEVWTSQDDQPESRHIKEEQEEVWTSQDDQPESRHIKEEQEEVWTSQDDQPKTRHIKEEQEEVWTSQDDQPEPRHIKEEQEEVWTSREQLQGLGEADIKFTFFPVAVKSEEEEEKPQSSQLHQRQTEDMKPEADGEDCGGPDSDPDQHLQPDIDVKTSHSSEPESDDSWDWEDTRETQSRLKSLQNNEEPGSDLDCNTVETSKGFKHNRHLQRRNKVQNREKPFKCSVCGRRYSREEPYTAHMKLHSEGKHFSCSFCKKTFRQRGNVVTHMRIHTGEKPFSCPFCDRKFARSSGLTSHMRVHTGEKPFRCSVCGKAFGQRLTLTRHMTFHTGEKPFRCSVCGKAFGKRLTLRRHMTFHTGETAFSHSVDVVDSRGDP